MFTPRRLASALALALPLLAAIFPLTHHAAAQVPTGVLPGQVIISEFRFRGPGGCVECAARTRATTPRRGHSPKAACACGSDPNRDEFIELYNNTDSDIVVADTAPIANSTPQQGWTLVAEPAPTMTPPPMAKASGTDHVAATPVSLVVVATIPDGTKIPARGHYLVANSVGYSLSGYPNGTPSGLGTSPDQDYDDTNVDIPDDSGVALFSTTDQNNFDITHRLDAVGFISATTVLRAPGGTARPLAADPIFYEGTPLLNPVTTDIEHSFVRKLNTGRPQDTDSNADDFILVTTDPSSLSNQQAFLGAPGPENSSSPINGNNLIHASLVEPCALSSDAPNRERDMNLFTSSNSNEYPNGTLLIRRRWTNDTQMPVTALRFRYVDLTTATSNSDSDVPGQAKLHAVDSNSTTPLTIMGQGCTGTTTVIVLGLTLDTPPDQPNDGGLNSSLSANVTLDRPLNPGDTIDINFLFGVEQTGHFRAYVNVEPSFDVPVMRVVTSKQKQLNGDQSNTQATKGRTTSKRVGGVFRQP
jgi:hypothetical protein